MERAVDSRRNSLRRACSCESYLRSRNDAAIGVCHDAGNGACFCVCSLSFEHLRGSRRNLRRERRSAKQEGGCEANCRQHVSNALSLRHFHPAAAAHSISIPGWDSAPEHESLTRTMQFPPYTTLCLTKGYSLLPKHRDFDPFET